MKKFIYVIIIIFFMSFLLTGCYYYGNKDIREDLQIYINNLNAINPERDDALNDYNSIVGDNYKSDDVSLVVFKKLIIPKYSNFLNNLKAINPTTEEVKNLHNIYLDSCTKQFNSLNGFKKSLEEKNFKRLKENQSLFKEALKEHKKFEKELKKLTSKYKVKLDIN